LREWGYVVVVVGERLEFGDAGVLRRGVWCGRSQRGEV
jgi:hypothetical protein